MMEHRIKKLFCFLVSIVIALPAFAEVTVDRITYATHENRGAKWAEIKKGRCPFFGRVVIPSSVQYNGVSWPVTKIGSGAFKGWTALTSITIPNSVTKIGDEAFFCCTGLTSITIPDSVTWIGESAFKGCTGLRSITIPNSVTEIGESAFSGCTGLTSITIPNSVREIGGEAFGGCTGLTSITIPNSVTWIGPYAFDGCTGLEYVRISRDVAPYVKDHLLKEISELNANRDDEIGVIIF